MFERIVEHAIPLLGDFTNLVNEVALDDTCMSDKQTIKLSGKVITHFSRIMATIFGFDAKWDQYGPMEKLTFHEMGHNLK